MSNGLKEDHSDSDLDKDAKASGLKLKELKGDRHSDDIPLSDDYWIALKYHRRAYDRGWK
jgi:hypothetical protein